MVLEECTKGEEINWNYESALVTVIPAKKRFLVKIIILPEKKQII